jgi:tetratricopeptide (TPR) repeat protein
VAKKKSRVQRSKARARQAAVTPVVRGREALHRGDYDAAIPAWEQALEEDPSPEVSAALAEVHFRRGLSRLYRGGQREAGLADLREAARLVPSDPRFMYHVGLAHHKQGKLDLALQAYQMALQADPTFARAADLAVLALLEKGRDPSQTTVWKNLSSDSRTELTALAGLLAGQPAAARRRSPTSRGARRWQALAALESGDGGAVEAVKLVAQSSDEPAAVRALAAYALGLHALQNNHQEEALGHWEVARRLGLDTPAFRHNLYELYCDQAEQAMMQGQWAAAATRTGAAWSLAPGEQELKNLWSAAHVYAGHADAEAGQWQQAVVHWEQARDLGDNSRELLQNLALAYERVERFAEAAELWRQVVRRRPRKANAPDALTSRQVALLWGHAAACYRRVGNVEEAITTLRNAVKNDPANSDLALELVDALIADDRWDAASNELDRVLKKEPENVGALVRSARIEEGGWYPADAQSIWRKVLALEPNHPEAREHLAELLKREGDYLRSFRVDDALERYREALTYLPEEPYLYLSCADCYLGKKDVEAARSEMERAFALQPDDLHLYHDAVDLCHVEGYSQEAEWVLTRAGQMAGPLPSGFYLDLAECGFKRHQAEVAEDYVRRAEQAAQDNPDGLALLALFYLDRDDLGRAVACLEQALRLDPEHGQANLQMGMRYAGAAQMREANRYWRQARRTARRTGDQELLEAVDNASRYFALVIDMVERGLDPSQLLSGLSMEGLDDYDDDEIE